YAERYDRDAIYSRDRDISSNANFTRFGGPGEHSGELDARSGDFAGRVGDFVYQPQLNGGALTPPPHTQLNLPLEPGPGDLIVGQYRLLASLPRGQQLFNVNALTPAMAPVDREYLYGSLASKNFGPNL